MLFQYCLMMFYHFIIFPFPPASGVDGVDGIEWSCFLGVYKVIETRKYNKQENNQPGLGWKVERFWMRIAAFVGVEGPGKCYQI